MNPLPECCFPHSAPIPHQSVMKVYVDAWIYVTEKFVNMGNIELYEGVLRYEKADYPPIPNFMAKLLYQSHDAAFYYSRPGAKMQEISSARAANRPAGRRNFPSCEKKPRFLLYFSTFTLYNITVRNIKGGNHHGERENSRCG